MIKNIYMIAPIKKKKSLWENPLSILGKNSQQTKNTKELSQCDKGHLPKTYT